jgi:hypothetical protein
MNCDKCGCDLMEAYADYGDEAEAIELDSFCHDCERHLCRDCAQWDDFEELDDYICMDCQENYKEAAHG